jgi:hypothetical protein
MVNMKRIKILITILVGLSLIGCGNGGLLFGGQTDPLAGKDKAAQGGTEKPNPDQKPPAVDPNAIMVDVVDAVNLELNKLGEIEISGRVLLAGFSKKIQIQNLTEFPGATFDPVAGLFKWTPLNTIFVGSEKTWRGGLIVRVSAMGPNQTIYIKEKTINISVDKLPLPLRVNRLEANDKNKIVTEGSINNFYTAEIFDPNATADQNTWPLVVFESAPMGSGMLSVASFAKVTKIESSGAGKFIATILLEPNFELTKTKTNYNMSVHAVSSFGIKSNSLSTTISVVNKLAQSKTSWVEPLTLYNGQKNNYSFIYYNPKDEGFIQPPKFTNLPTGMSIKCSNPGGSSNPCFVDWDLTASTVSGDFSLNGTIETLNIFNEQAGKIQDVFIHKVKVLKGPQPSPGGDL